MARAGEPTTSGIGPRSTRNSRNRLATRSEAVPLEFGQSSSGRVADILGQCVCFRPRSGRVSPKLGRFRPTLRHFGQAWVFDDVCPYTPESSRSKASLGRKRRIVRGPVRRFSCTMWCHRSACEALQLHSFRNDYCDDSEDAQSRYALHTHRHALLERSLPKIGTRLLSTVLQCVSDSNNFWRAPLVRVRRNGMWLKRRVWRPTRRRAMQRSRPCLQAPTHTSLERAVEMRPSATMRGQHAHMVSRGGISCRSRTTWHRRAGARPCWAAGRRPRMSGRRRRWRCPPGIANATHLCARTWQRR